MSDLYTDLGVKRDATFEEIKAAHRTRVKKAHPDNQGNREEFEKIQHAYLVLKDPVKRKHYDEHGKEKEPKTDAALDLIAHIFDMLLNKDNDSEINYINAIKATLNNMIAESIGRRIINARTIRRFEKLKKRFHHKKQDTNFFIIALDTKIRDQKQAIDRADEVIENARKALRILKQYEYQPGEDLL